MSGDQTDLVGDEQGVLPLPGAGAGSESTGTPGLSREERTLLVLARTARSRAHAPRTGRAQGAAVRDTDGRTYAAATFEVDRPGWGTGDADVSAVRGAVAAAASSGVRALETVCLVDEDPTLSDADRAAVAELGGAAVVLAAPDGTVLLRQEAWRP